MSQPLIFKKQIITDLILLITLIAACFMNADRNILIVTFFFFINTLGITFIPSIRGFKYAGTLRHIIYYLPMILPLFFFSLPLDRVNNFEGIIFGVLIGVLLLLSNYKQNLEIILGESIKSKTPVDRGQIISEAFTAFIPPVCEELFYRYFLIGVLYHSIGYYSIIISTLLFVYSHYINRWADVMFNAKSYIYHTITGVLFSMLYIYTGSILGCIIAHILFNSMDLVVLYKRIRNTRKQAQSKGSFFDDYN